MSDRRRRVPRLYDFRLNGGCIIPALSSGKRDKIHSICLLPTFVDEPIAMGESTHSCDHARIHSGRHSRSLFPCMCCLSMHCYLAISSLKS